MKTKLVFNLTRGEPVCVGEVADRPLSRLRGLLGRSTLAAGEGVLIHPAPAIHTAFMRFSIDALFLDRRMRVLDIVESVPPWRVLSRRHARSVLELAAGECARIGVRVGDRLALQERRESVHAERRPAEQVFARARGPVTRLDAGAARRRDAEPEVHPERRFPPRAAARGMRVLVASRDRRFRSATAMLLLHRGCEVTTTSTTANIRELVRRDRIEVVLWDLTVDPEGGTTPHFAAALGRSVGIVLVGEQRTAAGSGDDGVLAKWGPFEHLFTAIGDARSRGAEWKLGW